MAGRLPAEVPGWQKMHRKEHVKWFCNRGMAYAFLPQMCCCFWVLANLEAGPEAYIVSWNPGKVVWKVMGEGSRCAPHLFDSGYNWPACWQVLWFLIR